jgi:hypothetical protein
MGSESVHRRSGRRPDRPDAASAARARRPRVRLAVTGAAGILTIVALVAAPFAGDTVPSRSRALRTASLVTLPTGTERPSRESLTVVVQRYCQVCHNSQLLTGNLSLEGFDVGAAADRPETAEKMIHKLRAQMMPPPGMPRPPADTLRMLVETLESVMDEAAARAPNPGSRTVQRLNRAEYERAIRDLLNLEIEAARWLPADQMSANFDNIADAQALSPTLLDAYLNAANDIGRLAIGDPNAPSTNTTYSNSEFVSQHGRDHIEGAPYGTRGGVVAKHNFPADGHYVFRMSVDLGNGARLEDIDVSIDGEPVAQLQYESGVPIRTEPIFVRAGQRLVAAAFIRKQEGPFEDLIRPHDWSQAGSGNSGAGTTSLPHLTDLVISGPENATGVSVTPSRLKVFGCRPTVPAEELPCARDILARLGSEAYRRPLGERDLAGLMSFYEAGAGEARDFERAIESALRALLASPHFIFRAEREPAGTRPGETYRVDDVDLASRLSFFLWGTTPDEELLDVARRGKLSDTRVLEDQTHRMLRDPRAEALATRFAAQWLRLQDLDKVAPDAFWFPDYDRNLADAMRRETELFFHDLVREDRSLLELYSADHTFVNERLARHYGIPGVVGRSFQRVTYPDATRRGIFGHGSILVQTSLGNRTSPVLRGKWVMEVLLGTPPPPPPPGVPDLEETGESKDGRILTTRERMEQHRSSPICRSCHQYMDPIGLSLDNFDVTGKWRYRENGMPLDTRGELYDGTAVSTPDELSRALLQRPVPLIRTFTANLLAYAIGRRVEWYDQPAIRTITREAARNDHRLSSFILGVVMSDPFQRKRAEATTNAGGSGSANHPRSRNEP